MLYINKASHFFISLILISLVLISLAACSPSLSSALPQTIRWNEISAEDIAQTPFKLVDPEVLNSAYEQRGFVSVPLNYDDRAGRQLNIFYRLMPSHGSTTAALNKPILVVMNGGPGSPSSDYRALNHNYQSSNDLDAFSELGKYFRILAVDQRGTGQSMPLNLDSPKLSQKIIARYFDADEHARDHAEVIAAVIPKNEKFFILARSYGGLIGFQYLTLEGELRAPAGMVMSSAVQPHADSIQVFAARRKKQLDLNRQLLASNPDFKNQINRLRRHLVSLGIDPNNVHRLWHYLGKDVGWEKSLAQKIDTLLNISDREIIESNLYDGTSSTVNLLNYVLSSAALTPGYTDRTMTIKTSHMIPFENWMLDENWTLNQIGKDGSWREEFINAVDNTPPPETVIPPVSKIRDALRHHQILFTFGRSDAFLSQEEQLKDAKRFEIANHTQFHVFEGGHGASFSEEGARTVWQWAQNLLKENPNTKKQ